MIGLTRLNGTPVVVNTDQIIWIERHPDTVVALANGDKLFVRESPAEIVDLAAAFKQRVLGHAGRVVSFPRPAGGTS